MTPEERWIIEGRTREAFRESKKIVAVLRADIAEHAAKLKEASEHLSRTIASSPKPGPTGMTPAQYFMRFFAAFVTPEIAAKLKALEEESARLGELEAQVKEFE